MLSARASISKLSTKAQTKNNKTSQTNNKKQKQEQKRRRKDVNEKIFDEEQNSSFVSPLLRQFMLSQDRKRIITSRLLYISK